MDWGKLLGGIGSVVAAPFTAGGSLAALPAILSSVGSVASGAAAGRASGRAAEADVNNRNDALKISAARLLEDALQGRANLTLNQQKMLEDALSSRNTTDLSQRTFALNAPGARAKNAVRGDTLANVQDASLGGLPSRIKVPTISGGSRPSMLSGDTRALGKSMSRDALLQQMAGDKFDAPPPMPTFDKMPAPSIPTITGVPQSNALDTILNTVGGVGAGFGALQDAGLFDGGRSASGAASRPAAGGTGLPVGNPGIPNFTGFDPNAPEGRPWWEQMPGAGG